MGVVLFAVATAVATFALLVVGGLVNPTGSSLACPDWPTCYGSFFPEMKNGVQYEHSHRLVATAVGLMTIGLAIWIWQSRKEQWKLRAMGFLAVGLVMVQGLLGGITVILRLPMAVSTAHLALSMFFFCFLIYLSFWLWRTEPGRRLEKAPEPYRPIVATAAVSVYGQILLGALVRHTKSGRACGDDFPWCLGEIWPTWGPSQLHMLHRFSGYAVFAIVLLASVLVLRRLRPAQRPLAWWAALGAPLLALLQVGLGIWTVLTGVAVMPVAAHLAVGALLLADLVTAYLALGPMPQRQEQSRALSAGQMPAVQRPLGERI